MKKTMAMVLAWLLLAAPGRAGDPAPQEIDPVADQAIVVTLKWNGPDLEVDKTEKQQRQVPQQHGFPQLWNRFFVLQNADEDVYYSGPIIDPRTMEKDPNAKPASMTLVLPDLPDARHFIVYERDGTDADTQLKTLLDKQL